MDDLLQKINTRLQQYNRDELMALIWDFLSDRNEDDLSEFLNLMRQKSRPMAVEALELKDDAALLRSIQKLHDAIANDEYVQYGSGYDPDYGEYRGFGDDGWIDEMDRLFAATTSLYRAGNYRTAAAGYIALFDIFGLDEDGYHFTRPDPTEALQTDLKVMQQHLFTALGTLNPDPAAQVLEDANEDDQTLIGLSSNMRFYGGDRYALLDAWANHPDWMRGLEAYLLEACRLPVNQEQSTYGLSHAAELLREAYRRAHSLTERETLCREVGPQQGWPYEDLVNAYQEQEQWPQVLAWADDGLAKLPPQNVYRPKLEESRGTALLRLDRPAEALVTLKSLFKRQRDVSIYLTLRAAAQATGDWAQLYPQLTAEIEQLVLAPVAERTSGFISGSPTLAALLGYAHLLEGQTERALAWALRSDIPTGWRDDDPCRTVGSGLLRMGLAAARSQPNDVLQTALGGAPTIIREQGQLLDTTALILHPNPLLDGAVLCYERLVTRAVDGRKRESYAVAGSYAKIISAIRKLQGRGSDFDAYYRSLFNTYPRLPAFKDELRNAIEGPGYTQGHRI